MRRFDEKLFLDLHHFLDKAGLRLAPEERLKSIKRVDALVCEIVHGALLFLRVVLEEGHYSAMLMRYLV